MSLKYEPASESHSAGLAREEGSQDNRKKKLGMRMPFSAFNQRPVCVSVCMSVCVCVLCVLCVCVRE